MMIKFNLCLSLESVKVHSKDSLFVCGSCKSLGEWNVNNAIEMRMKLSDDTGSLSSLSSNSSESQYFNENLTVDFEAFVNINEATEGSENEPFYYKYFIAQKTQEKTHMFLKHIEHSCRKLNPSSNLVICSDKWPYVNDENKTVRIDNGWLLNGENEIQFHFFDSPLQMWMDTGAPKAYSVIIKPYCKTSNGLVELNDYIINRSNFTETEILNDKITPFNALNNSNVYTSIRFRSYENPSNLMFQVVIYDYNEFGVLNEKSLATGYYKVNKSLLENDLVEVDLSLIDSNLAIGSLRTEILLITNIQESHNYLIRSNFNYHFKQSCIPIGHRGMGKTFGTDNQLPSTYFVENTIDSFREAFNRGAQMVEFDVVLTKDKVPIIYHDFSFCIDHYQNEALNQNKYIDIAVNQLTYEEIKQNRIYSRKILKSSEQIPLSLDRQNYTSKLMFPTLKEMCTQLDSKLGFNVEVKYPLDLEDGTHEAANIKWLNRNQYVDIIIKELYAASALDNQRCVIVTTFDPHLCAMIRKKQSKFPVLFLTNGKTNRWIPYKDYRCKNTQISINYARAEGFHGIVAHSEELSQNLHLTKILFSHTAKSTNFLSYCWGDELNEIEKRKLFLEHGVNGIIYDRINELQ